MEPTGYLHARYARSLREFGSPRQLPASGAWILVRPVSHRAALDATGCYPLLVCRNWLALADDLETCRDLVSIAAVTDPFGGYSEDLLRRCFPDIMTPFKQHFVTDLSVPIDQCVSAHHRRNARRALTSLAVEDCPTPATYADDWVRLYAHLIARHRIHGMAAFSATSLREQLEVPGLTVFRAVAGRQTVGMILWMSRAKIAYYHLGAYSDEGYRLGASFALFWTAMRHFRARGFRWLSLGAGPGIRDQPDSGLVRFKSGWSTGTRWAYFCGRIFDRPAYARLTEPHGSTADFFPAYRRYEQI